MSSLFSIHEKIKKNWYVKFIGFHVSFQIEWKDKEYEIYHLSDEIWMNSNGKFESEMKYSEMNMKSNGLVNSKTT